MTLQWDREWQGSCAHARLPPSKGPGSDLTLPAFGRAWACCSCSRERGAQEPVLARFY